MAKKILIIDDEPDIRTVIKQVLDTAGYTVLTAGNAKDAIEQINKSDPDLIFLDIQMPDDSGLAVANELHRKQLAIPFILCTATVLDDPIQAYELFVVKHLYVGTLKKPFKIEEILPLVEKGLKMGKNRATA
ncbi:MAG: response regulator [bacterium]|nr:response regulator [bacterium]